MIKKILLLTLFCSSFLFANIGQISALSGKVSIERESNTLQGKSGFILKQQDIINTGKNSRAQVVFSDDTVITIGQNAILDIKEFVFDEQNTGDASADIGFMQGTFKNITGKIGKIAPERFKLKTKSASIGIRGTIIIGDQTKIAVTEGEIAVTAQGVTQIVGAGMMTETPQGGIPSPPKVLDSQTLTQLENETKVENSTVPTTEVEEDRNEDEEKNEKQQEEDQTQENQQLNENEEEQAQQTSKEGQQNDEQQVATTFSADTNEEDEITIQDFDETGDIDDSSPQEISIADTQPEIETTPLNVENIVEDINEDQIEDNTQDNTQPEYSTQTYMGTGLRYEVIHSLSNSAYSGQTYEAGSRFTPIAYNDGTIEKRVDLYSAVDNSWETINSWTFDTTYDFHNIKQITNTETKTVSSAEETAETETIINLYLDNLGEFSILTEHVPEYTSVGNMNYTLFELEFSGAPPNMNSLKANTIYKYKMLTELEVLYYDNMASHGMFLDGSQSSYTPSIYLNSANNNMALSLDDFMYDYFGHDLIVMRLNEDGTISAKEYYFNHYNYYEGFETTQTTSLSASLYGSQLQGIGFDISGVDTYLDATSTQTESFDFKTAGLLKDNSTPITTGQAVMKGQRRGFIHDISEDSEYANINSLNTFNADGVENFSFAIDRDRGVITASGGDTLNEFTANNTDLTAYYIDDSRFAAVFTGAYEIQPGYSLINDSGWFLSVPDSFNTTDNIVEYDLTDDISWGYWTASFDDGANNFIHLDATSTWVAGIETAIADIPTTGTASFNGNIIGSVHDGYHSGPILMDVNNQFSATIDFEQNSVTGSLSFDDAAGGEWRATLNNSNLNAGSFAGTITNNGGTVTVDSGSYNGKLYGDGAVKAVGGGFEMQTTDGLSATGVFKGKKQ